MLNIHNPLLLTATVLNTVYTHSCKNKLKKTPFSGHALPGFSRSLLANSYKQILQVHTNALSSEKMVTFPNLL